MIVDERQLFKITASFENQKEFISSRAITVST